MCYVGVTIPDGEGVILGENMCPTSIMPLIIANWTGLCSGTRQEQTLDCKRWMSLLSAAKWEVGLHSGRSLISTISLLENVSRSIKYLTISVHAH